MLEYLMFAGVVISPFVLCGAVAFAVTGITLMFKTIKDSFTNAKFWSKHETSCIGCHYYSEARDQCQDWYFESHCFNKKHYRKGDN